MNDPQLANLLQQFRRETWESQSPITVNPLERFFVITKGRVELVRTDFATGRELTLLVLHPGDVFDVLPLLDGEPHALRPIALDPVTLLSVPLSCVREWMQTHPSFNQQLLPFLGRQMRALEELAGELTFYDTVTRLGRLLTKHLLPSHQPLTTARAPRPFVHDLSHEVLARMIGSVRVVVSRHIRELKKNGAVHSGRKHLAILDLKAIENKCDKIQIVYDNTRSLAHTSSSTPSSRS